MTKSEFLEKSRAIHGYKYKYIDLVEKIIYTDYISIEINNIVFTQRVNKHLSGKCPEKVTLKKTTKQFIEESIKIWGDRFDYSKTEYIGALKKVILFDKELGIFINQLPTLHLSGHVSKDIDSDIFIEMSKIVSDYKYDYSKCNYINKTTKVTLICQEHGDFNISPFNHLNYGDACKKCKYILINKQVRKFLNDNKISYYLQHRCINCKNIYPLPFDFYLPSIRTCIDFTDNYESLKINDRIKSDYCEEEYINLIRIRYDQFDDIYKILWDNLGGYIKKSNI